ncbi:MAG: hypothetical protein SNJ75_08335, partial [Gemmataceae bacterium]
MLTPTQSGRELSSRFLRSDWTGPPPVRLGKVWSFLGHQTPAADQDPLAFARWCIRHADTLKPLCGKSEI